MLRPSCGGIELEARQDYAGRWPGVLQEIKTFAESECGEQK